MRSPEVTRVLEAETERIMIELVRFKLLNHSSAVVHGRLQPPLSAVEFPKQNSKYRLKTNIRGMRI